MGLHVILDLAAPITVNDLREFVALAANASDPSKDTRRSEDGVPPYLAFELLPSETATEGVSE